MRWLFLAAMLSFLFHGLFFTLHFDWIKESRMTMPKDRTIAVGLSYKKPDRPSFVQNTHPIQKRTQKKKNPPQKIENKKPETLKKEKILSSPTLQKNEPVTETISHQMTDARSIQEESSDDLSGQNMPAEQNRYSPGSLSGSSGRNPDKNISAAYAVREAIPAYKDNPPPVYPRIARRKGHQGTVILEVLVNQNGKVEDLKVYQSSGYPTLDDAASTSVFKWTFLPGMKDNQPVEMWVKLPVRFQLQ